MKGHFHAGTVVRTGIVCMAAAVAFMGLTQSSLAQGRTRTTATKSIKASAAAGATANIRYSYFPSASTTDGRFISIVGSHLQSLTGDAIEFGIGLPGSTDSLRIGIFDGETSGKWDLGTSALEYKLYADSTASGDGMPLLYTWQGSNMTDNDWYNITVPVHAAARSSDTVYFYRLVITLTNTSTKTWSNFKVRTNGSAMLLPRAFSFAAPIFTTADAQILYPNYPSTSTTTYDGSWTFNLSIPESVEDIEIWDGDMDHGSYDGTARDVNDADTPDSIPSWAQNGTAVAEGVATSNDFIIVNNTRSTTTRMTGAPADDNANTWYRRSPSVTYKLTDPNGTVYENNNPSGNLEWERFRISTIMTSASDYDYLTTVLPRGTYKITLTGMDAGNLNAWRVWYSMLGATDTVTALGSASQSRKNTDGPSNSSYRSHPVMVGVDSAGTAIPAILPSTPDMGGVGNLNYWKNNNTAWPIEVITIAGTTYTRSQARDIMNGVTNDKSKQLARELITAKLNVLSGNNSSCIYQTIASAEAWLAANPIGSASPNWTTGRPLHDALEDYNKGRSGCASYRRGSLD
jgi:hypothetical protein